MSSRDSTSLGVDSRSVDNRTPEAEEESKARVKVRPALQHVSGSLLRLLLQLFRMHPALPVDDDFAPHEHALTPQSLVDAWERHLKDPSADAAAPAAAPAEGAVSGMGGGAHLGRIRPRASALEQTLVLVQRGTLNQLRDSLTLAGLFTESVVIAALAGAIFYKLHDSLPAITSRFALLYLVASLQCYQFLVFSIHTLVGELCIFDHESEDGMYGVTPYVTARVVILTPILLVFPTLFSVIVYFMTGLREGAGHVRRGNTAPAFTAFALLRLNLTEVSPPPSSISPADPHLYSSDGDRSLRCFRPGAHGRVVPAQLCASVTHREQYLYIPGLSQRVPRAAPKHPDLASLDSGYLLHQLRLPRPRQ